MIVVFDTIIDVHNVRKGMGLGGRKNVMTSYSACFPLETDLLKFVHVKS